MPSASGVTSMFDSNNHPVISQTQFQEGQLQMCRKNHKITPTCCRCCIKAARNGQALRILTDMRSQVMWQTHTCRRSTVHTSCFACAKLSLKPPQPMLPPVLTAARHAYAHSCIHHSAEAVLQNDRKPLCFSMHPTCTQSKPSTKTSRAACGMQLTLMCHRSPLASGPSLCHRCTSQVVPRQATARMDKLLISPTRWPLQTSS